jgi:multiple sugar transport system permease protein
MPPREVLMSTADDFIRAKAAALNMPVRQAARTRPRRWSPQRRRDLGWGLAFASPAIIGLAWFTLYPMAASLYYSFTHYSVFGGARWIGLTNYRTLLEDPNVWRSLKNSLYILGLSIPAGIAVALILALLLNLDVKGMSVYRTIFYLPSIMPAVAAAVVWGYVFNAQYGVVNDLLGKVGIQGPSWLASTTWAKPALVIMSVWGVGNLMIILLAGLQDVPKDLQDASKVDGANRFQSFRNVTIPFLGPHLFFAVITGLIAGFQYFTPVYVLTDGDGGPAGSTLVFPLYIYQNAFRYFNMGYASALAWVLMLITMAITAIVFRGLSRRIYYGGS